MSTRSEIPLNMSQAIFQSLIVDVEAISSPCTLVPTPCSESNILTWREGYEGAPYVLRDKDQSSEDLQIDLMSIGSSMLIEEASTQACFGCPIGTRGAFLFMDCLSFSSLIGSIFALTNQNKYKKKTKKEERRTRRKEEVKEDSAYLEAQPG